MKISPWSSITGAALLALAMTGCIVPGPGVRVVHVVAPPPPPPPIIPRQPEVVVVQPPPRVIEERREVVIVKPPPRIIEAPQEVVVVKPPPKVIVERQREVIVQRQTTVVEEPRIIVKEPPVFVPPPHRVISPPAPPIIVPTPPRVVVHEPEPPRVVVQQTAPEVVVKREPVRSSEVVVRTPEVRRESYQRHEPAGPVTVVFTSQEREIIYAHIKRQRENDRHGENDKHGEHGKGPKGGLPPGLAKKAEQHHDLPAGWERRCVRGAVIPADIYHRCEPLPQEVVVKLPPAPPNTILVTLDSKVFRLARASLEILDVFDVL